MPVCKVFENTELPKVGSCREKYILQRLNKQLMTLCSQSHSQYGGEPK